MSDKTKLGASSIFSAKEEKKAGEEEVYKLVVRKEGRRRVFDVYIVEGGKEIKRWEGLSPAGMRDIVEQIGYQD